MLILVIGGARGNTVPHQGPDSSTIKPTGVHGIRGRDTQDEAFNFHLIPSMPTDLIVDESGPRQLGSYNSGKQRREFHCNKGTRLIQTLHTKGQQLLTNLNLERAVHFSEANSVCVRKKGTLTRAIASPTLFLLRCTEDFISRTNQVELA